MGWHEPPQHHCLSDKVLYEIILIGKRKLSQVDSLTGDSGEGTLTSTWDEIERGKGRSCAKNLGAVPVSCYTWLACNSGNAELEDIAIVNSSQLV